MILAFNFDYAFEQKLMICITALVVIVSIALLHNVLKAAGNNPGLASPTSEPESVDDTGVTAVSEAPAECAGQHHSSAKYPNVPLLNRLLGTESATTKMGEATRRQQLQSTMEAFKPEGTAEEVLHPIFQKIADGNPNFRLNLKTAVEDIGTQAKKTLRDLLALTGDHDRLVALFVLEPTLKDPDFCTQMDALYAQLIDDLKDCRSPQGVIFWQRMRDALK